MAHSAEILVNGVLTQVTEFDSTAQQIDDAVNNMGGASTRQAALAAIGGRPRRNLLDNWYFVGGGSQQGGGQFPINQRGEMSYSGNSNTIDRWVLSSPGTGHSLLVTDSSINVVAGTMYVDIRQKVDSISGIIGKTVTLSVLYTNNELLTITGSIPETLPESEITCVTDSANLWIRGITGVVIAQIRANAEDTVSPIAAKLELGPTQTLAYQDEDGNWQLFETPDYGEELAKCQRYLQEWKFNNTYLTIPASGVTGTTTESVRVVLSLPVQLRTNPTVQFSSGLYVFAINDGEEVWLQITGVQWTQAYGNVGRIAFTVSSSAGISLPIVGLRSKDTTGEYLLLSAEL